MDSFKFPFANMSDDVTTCPDQHDKYTHISGNDKIITMINMLNKLKP